MGTDLAGRSPGNGPVIVLSYLHSGANVVQDLLATSADLACTTATGILPLCQMAAETWQRVEGQATQAMSQLALSTVRALVTAQVTTILAGAGKARWCELAVAAPSSLAPFRQVFPQTSFVCVYRNCLDVIRTGVQASPWGLQGQVLTPLLVAYPGNSAAALAAHWANSTEHLLKFEEANPGATHRVRYEDVIADPVHHLDPVRDALGLDVTADRGTLPDAHESTGPEPEVPGFDVPTDLIPGPLRARISHLHAELGYPHQSGDIRAV